MTRFDKRRDFSVVDEGYVELASGATGLGGEGGVGDILMVSKVLGTHPDETLILSGKVEFCVRLRALVEVMAGAVGT